MSQTIYAIFEEPFNAREVADSLIRDGAQAERFTVVTKPLGVAPTHDLQEPDDPSPLDLTFGSMPQAFPDLRAQGPGQSIGDPSMADPGIRVAGIAAGSNASVQPGQMTEFLWMSLPVDVVDSLKRAYDGGNTILVIKDPPGDAERLIAAYGAIRIYRHGYVA